MECGIGRAVKQVSAWPLEQELEQQLRPRAQDERVVACQLLCGVDVCALRDGGGLALRVSGLQLLGRSCLGQDGRGFDGGEMLEDSGVVVALGRPGCVAMSRGYGHEASRSWARRWKMRAHGCCGVLWCLM